METCESARKMYAKELSPKGGKTYTFVCVHVPVDTVLMLFIKKWLSQKCSLIFLGLDFLFKFNLDKSVTSVSVSQTGQIYTPAVENSLNVTFVLGIKFCFTCILNHLSFIYI